MVREQSDTVPSEPEALRLGEAGLRASDARPRPHAPEGDGAGTGSMSTRENEEEGAWPCPDQDPAAPHCRSDKRGRLENCKPAVNPVSR